MTIPSRRLSRRFPNRSFYNGLILPFIRYFVVHLASENAHDMHGVAHNVSGAFLTFAIVIGEFCLYGWED